MKKLNGFVFICLFPFALNAQKITGNWNGILKAGGTELRLVFHILKTDSGYSSTMDSPDQQSFGIKTNFTGFENGSLTIKADALQLNYTGRLINDSTINGQFKQGGFSAPLNLVTKPLEKKILNRPQEPKAPFPYYTEEVVFKNRNDSIQLSGTLSLPAKEGVYPIVILVTGSGPQNRNEELMGHKPFLVIADYLARNGIGVLRYDDRGVGKSKGKFSTATTNDFARDAAAAVDYLKGRKEAGKTGIAGHSEGGLIAPIVAAGNAKVDFIILLAGPGVSGYEILMAQTELIAKSEGMKKAALAKMHSENATIFGLVKNSVTREQLVTDLSAYLKKAIHKMPSGQIPKDQTPDDYVKQQVAQLTSLWMINFIKYDPAETLKKVTCPVLALNGSKDLQVPPNLNLPAIKKAVNSNGNQQVFIKEMNGLNHLFQQCKTGNPKEYAEIEQSFSPDALQEILLFIRLVTK
jgi:fermentation-respiration switch protein FrsA (DUF1100 family)